MKPAQSDLATKDRKKRALTAGLSAVGATAGAAGLALGAQHRSVLPDGQGSQEGCDAGKHVARAGRQAGDPMSSEGAGARGRQEKLATALVPLEVAGLGGELMATKILHGDTKKKEPVSKAEPDMLNNSRRSPNPRAS